ncbi:uncharacterized protein LOC107740643 [Sinocyclocheilus rhinocerous]|uniref:uncharacterized protein LOC107740643 n=1 Tax=Sinocyclocheilus rhinocerous TaxID=307959 RepID=UPI0007B9D32C|nr:PREDICTED: uncharacterized protein LOC107740643 [Sinocyclocheilus rhinocerous]
MIHPFVLFSLCLWSLVGVFGVDPDEMKSVSVMKGESVTLNPDVTEAQTYLLIQWKFGSTRIAEVNRLTQTNSTYDGPDGRFRDRLKRDQTGSLTITNTRTTDSGLYQLTVVKIETIYMSFNVTVYGVTEEVKSISVQEGDSVTLNPDVTEKQKYLLIQWMFGSTRIAEVNRLTQTSYTYDADGRFRDRLKLDPTGSLTITNTRTTDSGLYQLATVNRETSYMDYDVTVYERSSSTNCVASSCAMNNSSVNQTEDASVTELYQPSSDHIHCCGFTEAVIRLALSALVGVAAVAVLVYDIRSTRSELNMTEETQNLSQTHGAKSDQQYELSRRLSCRYVQI